MKNLEELLHSSEDRALRISKLLQLINMNQYSIEQHQKMGSTSLIVEQYQDLLKTRIAELQEIMQEVGIQIQLGELKEAA